MTSSGGASTHDFVESLYIRLEKPLFNIALRWLWSRHDAEEVVHEVFVRMIENFKRIDVAQIDAYLFRMVMNEASNRRRRKRFWHAITFNKFFGQEDENSNDNSNFSVFDKKKLAHAVDALPEKLKRVVVLTELAELKYAEVADILKIPAGTVASRRNAAMQILEESLVGEIQ